MKHIKERLIVAVIIAVIGFPLMLISKSCKGQCVGKLIESTDKYTRVLTIKTPFLEKGGNFNITANWNSNDSSIKLILFAYYKIFEPLPKGVYILFDDGSSYIDENKELSYGGGSSNIIFAEIVLNGELMGKIKKNKVVSFRLYINEAEISNKNSENFRCLFNSLIEKVYKDAISPYISTSAA